MEEITMYEIYLNNELYFRTSEPKLANDVFTRLATTCSDEDYVKEYGPMPDVRMDTRTVLDA